MFDVELQEHRGRPPVQGIISAASKKEEKKTDDNTSSHAYKNW